MDDRKRNRGKLDSTGCYHNPQKCLLVTETIMKISDIRERLENGEKLQGNNS